MTRTIGHDCRARTVLDRIGDKWSILVICQLDDGVKRFTDLKRNSAGVSQRMLTELIPLGHTLLATICDLLHWAEANVERIEKARRDYDQRTQAASVP